MDFEMTFDEAKEKLCGRDARNNPKVTVGFLYSMPFLDDESENETGEENWVIMPTDLMTIKKPEVDIKYVTEPLHDVELLRLDIKFRSSYDNDIQGMMDFLTDYTNEVDKNFQEPENCPSLSVLLIPNSFLNDENVNRAPEAPNHTYEMLYGNKNENDTETEEIDEDNPDDAFDDPYYMQCNFPIFYSLGSSAQSQAPDTITMLFLLSECYIVPADIDIDELKKEIREEEFDKERQKRQEAANIEAEKKRAEEQQRRLERMQKNYEQAAKENEEVVKVGRGSENTGE